MEKPRSFWMTIAITAVVVMLALAIYVGAYFWMVEPFGMREQTTVIVRPIYFCPGAGDTLSPSFQGWAGPVFAPAHWVDRKIRKRFWDPEGEVP